MDTKKDVVSEDALRRLSKKEEFNQLGKSFAQQLKQTTSTNNTKEFLTSFMAQCEGTLSIDEWQQVYTQLGKICKQIQQTDDKANKEAGKNQLQAISTQKKIARDNEFS